MYEEWRDVRGYEGYYQISNIGRIKSLKGWDVNSQDRTARDLIMSPTSNGNGYLIVRLSKGGKRQNKYIHRLVAEAFLPNPYGLSVVNHKDYDLSNNVVSNLEWCTQRDNILHSAWRMHHRNSYSFTNTGEMYITYRSKNNRYRVVVDHKEYKSCKTLEDAVALRDAVIRGEVVR